MSFLLLFCTVADKKPEELAVHRENGFAVSYYVSGIHHFHFSIAFRTKFV
jgi:hypothetical protein